MLVKIAIAALAAGSWTDIFARADVDAQGAATATTQCFSTMGSVSLKAVPTHFETVLLTATKTVLNEVQATTIVQKAGPKACSWMATNLEKNLSPLCNTVTKTSTKTVTVKSTKTTHIPTPSGFLPVSSTLPLPSDGSKVGNGHARGPAAPAAVAASSRKLRYPQQVDCKVFKGVTSTVTSVTALAAQTQFAIAYAGNAKTTTTTTVTVTKTHTNVIPGPTIYNACLSKNIEHYPGTDYVFLQQGSGSDYYITANNINSIYDCCVACITQFNCTGGLGGGSDAWTGSCSFSGNYVAGPQANSPQTIEYTDSYYDNGYPSPIFNGLNGRFTVAEYQAID